MGDGYGRNARRDIRSMQADPSSMHGLWDAVVVDDKDPLKMGRVRVRVFDLHDEDTPVGDLPWAIGNFPSAFINLQETDKSGGFFHIPPVDALVHVMFMRGDPEYPVWMGGWFPGEPAITGREGYTDGTRRKALYNGGAQPSCPTWRSLRGHSIEFDDEESEIRVTTPKGHKITLTDIPGNEHDDAIKLEDHKGNYIWMNTGRDLLQIRWDGDVEEHCTGYRHTTVDGDWFIKIGGILSVDITGLTHIKGAADIAMDAPTIYLNSGKAEPQPPNEVDQGEPSSGDGIGTVLARLGSAIKKIVVGG